MHYYDYYESPHGRMLLVADDKALTGVYFAGQKYQPRIERDWVRDGRHAPLRQARQELAEYFAGQRQRFTVKVAPRGTPFQRAVWKAIAGVGFGRTIPYAELARRAGHPGSARAAGAARRIGRRARALPGPRACARRVVSRRPQRPLRGSRALGLVIQRSTGQITSIAIQWRSLSF